MLSEKIRKATENDLEDILHLFQHTITAVNSKDYSLDQIEVWTNAAKNKERWLGKIRDQYFIVCINGNILFGFASITNTGYLDFMYVNKDYQGLGIAKKLYAELEAYARQQKISTIFSDVSITAKPFFMKQGFSTVQEQQVIVEGIVLINYKMEKLLPV